jgi:hypothetical protein
MEAAAADEKYDEALKILATLSKKVDEKLAEEGRIDRKIIGSAQKERADKKLAALDEESRKQYNKLAEQAKSPQELDYLSKALASNHSIDDIEKFAAKIRGKDEKWLNDNLKLTGSSTGTGVQQQWSHSCNATAAQAVRGELDPIYALKLHEENKDLTTVDNADATKINPKLAEEQRKALESDYKGGVSGGGKGKAVSMDEHKKNATGRGRWNDDLLNNMSDSTGVEYSNKKVDGATYKVDDAMKDVEKAAKSGHPVPIVVGGSSNDFAHYVVVTKVDPGPPKTWTIHDVGSGKTFTKNADDIKNNNMGIGTYNQITALENPSAKK